MAADGGGRPWFIDGATGAVTTYGELLEELRSGDPLRPWVRPANTREAFIELLRAMLAHADLMLLDTNFGDAELSQLQLDASHLQRTDHTRRPRHVRDVGELSALVQSGQSSRLSLLTSGSTGLPKIVAHSMSSLARGVRVSERHSGDVWALAYSSTHIAGLQVFLQALANGNPLIDVFSLDRAAVRATLERHDATHISATPTFYRLLLPVPPPLTTIRSVTVGGESSDASLIQRLTELFPSARVRNIYASTEAGTLLISDGDTFGIPEALAGLIEVRHQRLHVHESLLGRFDSGARVAGGWYDTGDVAEIVQDEPLRFRLVARERDWINVGGNKVNPFEVEAVLEQCGGVRKARVFGRPNSVVGHILCAEVACDEPPPSEQALRAFVADRLQPFKVPRLIKHVEELALTRTGKLKR